MAPKRISKVAKYFTDITENQDGVSRLFECNLCKKKVKMSKDTLSNRNRHIAKSHPEVQAALDREDTSPGGSPSITPYLMSTRKMKTDSSEHKQGSDVQTPVEADAAVPPSPAVLSSAAPADTGTESTDVSTRSPPVDGPYMPSSKTVRGVAVNRQAKKTAVSETPAKSKKAYPRSTARKRRPKTVNKGAQFKTCLSSLSVRKLLLDIRNTVTKMGMTWMKMQQRPVERSYAVSEFCPAGVRYKHVLEAINMPQLLLSCNELIGSNFHQDLLFCRVCQAGCETAEHRPHCSDDEFGLFRYNLNKGHGEFTMSPYDFIALRHDVWKHLNDSKHVRKLESWFTLNHVRLQPDHQVQGSNCPDHAPVVERFGEISSVHKNSHQPDRPANTVTETDPLHVTFSCGKAAAASGSSHRSGVAGDQLEDFCAVVKEEPVAADTEVHAEGVLSRPVLSSTFTNQSKSPAHAQSFLSQHLLPAGHSQSPVIISEGNGGVLSTPADRNNTNGRRVVSDADLKALTPRVRRPSYVRVPAKASSSDGDGCREPPGTCGPSKRTRTDAQTDNLSKRPKTNRNR